MAWDDIASDPEYQGLDVSEKERVRTEYFQERVAPNVPQAELELARESFMRDTAPEQQAFDFASTMAEPVKAAGRAMGAVKDASVALAKPIAAPIDRAIGKVDKALTPDIDTQALPAIAEAAGLATGKLVEKGADLMGLGGLQKRVSKDVASGGMGTISGFAGLGRALGMENFGALVAQSADATSRELLPPDPALADEVAAGMGSMAVFMVPGFGVQMGAGRVAMVAPRLAQFLGVSTASVLEAGVEGGSAYNRVMDKTGNKDDAMVAGNQAFWANVPLVYFTNKLGWAGEQSSRAVRALESVLTEGSQEASQELVGTWAAKDPLVLGQIAKAFAIGGAVGGVAGAAMHSTMQPEATGPGTGKPVNLVPAAEAEGGGQPTPAPASSSIPVEGVEGAPAPAAVEVPPPVPPSVPESESQPPAPAAEPASPGSTPPGTPASSPYFESIRAEAKKNKWGYGAQPAVDRGIHPEILSEMEGLIQKSDEREVKADFSIDKGVYERARASMQRQAESQLDEFIAKVPENVTPKQAAHLIASMERAIKRWHLATGSETIPAEVLQVVERLKAAAKPEKAPSAPAPEPGTPPKAKKGKKAPKSEPVEEVEEAAEAQKDPVTVRRSEYRKMAETQFPVGNTITWTDEKGKSRSAVVSGHAWNTEGFQVVGHEGKKKVVVGMEELGVGALPPLPAAPEATESAPQTTEDEFSPEAIPGEGVQVLPRDRNQEKGSEYLYQGKGEFKAFYNGNEVRNPKANEQGTEYNTFLTEEDARAAAEQFKAVRDAAIPWWDGIYSKYKLDSDEESILRAISAFGGSEMRWYEVATRGATDAQIKDALSFELGDHGGSSGPGMRAVSHKGGPNPSIWLDAVIAKGKPTLSGRKLISRVREILEIPQPGAKKKAKLLPSPKSVKAQKVTREDAQIARAAEAYRHLTPPKKWAKKPDAFFTQLGDDEITLKKLYALAQNTGGKNTPVLQGNVTTSYFQILDMVYKEMGREAGALVQQRVEGARPVSAPETPEAPTPATAKSAEAEAYRSQAELASKAAVESEEAIQKLKAVSPEPTAVVEEKIKAYETQVVEYQKQAQDLLEKAAQAEAQASVLRESTQEPPKPVAPLLRKGGGGGGSGRASKGTFAHDTPVEMGGIDSIKPIRMPEMVRLATEIMGQVPTLKKFPKAYGMFYGRGGGEIKLNPEIFKDPQQAAKTLAHEIGHLTDYLPDHTLKRGNLLGSLHSLRQFLKESFGGELFSGQQGHGVTNKDIRNELLAVTHYWKPWDEATSPASYNSYRKSARELYADAISVLFNSPGTLERMAPKFYKAFFEHLDRKPAVKLAFFEVQAFLHQPEGEIRAARHQDIRLMFAKGEGIWAQKRAEQEVRENRLIEDFRRRFDDKFFPILKKVEALESQGVAVPNSENPKYLLEELSLADAANHAMLARLDKEVKSVLDKAEVDLMDAGAYMMLTRIAAGDRQTFANPKGYSPEEATKQLEFLAAKLGNERHATMLQAVDKLHDIIFEVNQEAVSVGAYNVETFNEKIVPNRKTYASFAVLKYLDDYIPAAIKSQVGTLEDIANPFTTTIMKAMSTNRLIALQKAKNSFKNIWLEHYPSEISKAKPLNPQDHIRQYRKEPGMGQLTILENGKPVAYNVDPFIAEAFEKRPAGEMAVAMRLLQSVNNGIFRPLYITFNLGFSVVSNPIRDFKRTYKNLPVASLKQILVEYARALPVAYRREAGIKDELINEMIASKALDIPFNDFNLDPEKDQLGAIMAKMGLLEGVETNTWMDKAARYKLLKPVIKVLEGIRFVGSVLETVPKVAGYQILKKDTLAKLDQAISQSEDQDQKARLIKQRQAIQAGQGEYAHELAYQVRNYVGTPNFRRGGIDTKTTNTIFMFSNIMKEGMKSDYQVATNPKTRGGYMMRTTLVDLMPKLLMLLAAAGAGGDELEEFFGKVSEYDKTNYTVIPLGWTEKADGSGRKAVYLRVPHDEGGRLAAGVFWKLAGALKGDLRQWQQVLDFGAGQLPGFAPPIKIAYMWEQFLTGKNPYDTFRGRPVIADAEFKAGGYPALKKMVKWTVNQFGIADFASHDSSGKTITEQAMEVTPLLNRLIKVSDYGVQEQERAAIASHQAERARLRIDRGEAAKDFTKERYILIQKQQANILSSEDRARLAKLNKYLPAYKAYTKSIEHSIKKGDVEEAERLRDKLDAMLERLGP